MWPKRASYRVARRLLKGSPRRHALSRRRQAPCFLPPGHAPVAAAGRGFTVEAQSARRKAAEADGVYGAHARGGRRHRPSTPRTVLRRRLVLLVLFGLVVVFCCCLSSLRCRGHERAGCSLNALRAAGGGASGAVVGRRRVVAWSWRARRKFKAPKACALPDRRDGTLGQYASTAKRGAQQQQKGCVRRGLQGKDKTIFSLCAAVTAPSRLNAVLPTTQKSFVNTPQK